VTIFDSQVVDIENPFSHGLKRFQYTFNKLHLWNMTEYERVIYLDADNIVLNQTIIEELFYCGHFCVVYMNPCHFHTGLMVVKPDAAVLQSMLAALADTGSYDGADQGFLSEYFKACDAAPMYNARKGPSNSPLNQLHIGYNMHTIYRLGVGNYERFRCGSFQECPGDPIASMGFPLPTVIKPWYWWSPMVGHTPDWNSIRANLPEPEMPVLITSRLTLAAVSFFVLQYFVTSLTSREPKHTLINTLALRIGLRVSAVVCATVVLFTVNRITMLLFPPIVPAMWGVVLYASYHFPSMLLASRLIGHYVFLLRGTTQVPIVRAADWLPAFAGFVSIFLAWYWDRVLFAVLGSGLYIPILRATMVLSAMVIGHLSVFLKLAARSPLGKPTALHPATPAKTASVV
jgi:hypothetical protein